MLLCLPLLGIHAFERPESTKTRSEVLELKGKGIVALGFDTANGFLVKRGSQAVANPVPSMQPYVQELRRVLLEQGILKDKTSVFELARDYQFDSPSTAASAMLGKSANGRIEWKNKMGKTLKELQDEIDGRL